MEIRAQNPEFWNNPENFHPCEIERCESKAAVKRKS